MPDNLRHQVLTVGKGASAGTAPHGTRRLTVTVQKADSNANRARIWIL
jgi:hypothetical protein